MTTHKRDTYSVCPVCYKTFKQDGIGRMRKYCSNACKQKAHRQAQAGGESTAFRNTEGGA